GRMSTGSQGGYGYDALGNQTSRTLPGGSWSLVWNGQNQLTQAASATTTVNFKYDPFGRRIEKKVIDATGTTTHTYVYDGEDIAFESVYDGTATTTTHYVHGPGIDEPLAMVRGGQVYCYHADGLGSIVALTDNTQAVVQSYSYEVFGLAAPSGSMDQPYGFTGREFDPETGLYFYRARYYDPMEGRFISKDPLGFAAGDVNLFGYVQNNPVNWIDPWGLDSLVADHGTITHYADNGKVVGSYPYSSGRNGVTDPSVPNQGPIPPGNYSLDPKTISEGGFLRNLLGDWGKYRAPLNPHPSTDTYGRDGFFLHGGKSPGSAGCVDLGSGDEVLFPKLIGHDGLIPVIVK
ncbi:MAG: RHS repeat-associated core domain-containing protein, partial [Desulfomonilia bacterium]